MSPLFMADEPRSLDQTAVDFLEPDYPTAYKIESFELIDLPLIRNAVSKGRPMMMSTGMASVGEIEAAVCAAREAGASVITLLRCHSGYPADPSEMDLWVIPVTAQMWQVLVRLSDRTLSNTASIPAVAMCACMVVKHVTLRPNDGGPDAAFSLQPDELASLVRDVRQAHDLLAAVRFGRTQREQSSIAFCPSPPALLPITAGTVSSAKDVRSVRPAGGLHPDDLDLVLGQKASRDLEHGDPIAWQDLVAGDDV